MKNILCFGDSNTYGLKPEWIKGDFGRQFCAAYRTVPEKPGTVRGVLLDVCHRVYPQYLL